MTPEQSRSILLILTLQGALRAYIKAQSRMLERWADGDENVKRDLWQALHACEGTGRRASDLVDLWVSEDDAIAAILSAPTEDILAVTRADGKDPDRLAIEMRTLFERVAQASKSEDV